LKKKPTFSLHLFLREEGTNNMKGFWLRMEKYLKETDKGVFIFSCF
jgi:hypothetical protein